MDSEDKLFHILKQVPLGETMRLMNQSHSSPEYLNDTGWASDRSAQKLKEYGWTFIEMYNAKCGEDPPDEWLESR